MQVFKSITLNYLKIWRSIVAKMDDVKGEKDTSNVPKLSKKLLVSSLLAFPGFQPSVYLHTFSFHLSDYYEELKKVAKMVGFPISLKLLSQTPVEAGHK